MSKENWIVDVEGQRGFFQILILLHRKKELLQSQLYNNKPDISISNNATAIRAIRLLTKYGLVKEKRRKKNNGKYYSLTKQGQICANLFIQFQKQIDDQFLNKTEK